ncbi:MAG: DUF4917 family protein [Chloroflexota bacterium]
MLKRIRNTIVPWSQIAKRFDKADLLLGNGFSLNIEGHFNYVSLFKEFINSCNRTDGEVFKSFNTNNFELILEKLSNALFVNKAFDIEYSQIDVAIDQLKTGLITAIKDNHPRNNQLDKDQLKRIAIQLKDFNDIFTLNYDLFLYHIIMLVLDESKKPKSKVKAYSDYFWGSYNSDFKKFEDHQDYEYKLLYYLHGALFIFTESYEIILKLIRGDVNTELIGQIEDAIQKDMIPLFVTEGLPEEKLQAINQSKYLQFALSNLKNSNNKLVIFGCSLSSSDDHIVKAIKNNKRDLAISIHTKDKTENQLIRTQQFYEDKFPESNVDFFDSDTLFHFRNHN